jgi:hypothetical protein
MSDMRGKVWAFVAMAAVLGACGDDDPSGPDEPDLTREDVAGEYTLVTLSFDPSGSLPAANLLDRIDFAEVPSLIVAANEDSLQLVFRVNGELLRIVPGGYDLRDDGITAELQNALVPAEILMPRTLLYDYNELQGTLRFSGAMSADTTRLFELVPEWSGEPVTDPLPGVLTVVFDRDGENDQL